MDNLLYDRLKTVAANVYPGAAPLDYQRPCVIYNRTDTDPTRSFDDDDTTAFVRFQIDVYSTNRNEAIALAKVIRNNLKSWISSVVQSVSFVNRQDMIDNTTQTQLYRVMQSFLIFGSDD